MLDLVVVELPESTVCDLCFRRVQEGRVLTLIYFILPLVFGHAL